VNVQRTEKFATLETVFLIFIMILTRVNVQQITLVKIVNVRSDLDQFSSLIPIFY